MKPIKVTPKQIAALQAKVTTELFSYQRNWINAGLYHRNRMITKCRQIGADWTFSLEALIDVLTSHRNQYFVADTLGAAEVARTYIIQHLHSVGVKVSELQNLTFSGGYKIEFIDNDTYLAGKCGNAYFTEFAWADHLSDLTNKTAVLARHDDHRRTFYSSASYSLEAGRLWEGSSIKPVAEHRFFSFGGVKEIDGIWRQSVTAIDAINDGFAIFDLDRIKDDHTENAFNMLFMCQWPGRGDSIMGKQHV